LLGVLVGALIRIIFESLPSDCMHLSVGITAVVQLVQVISQSRKPVPSAKALKKDPGESWRQVFKGNAETVAGSPVQSEPTFRLNTQNLINAKTTFRI
jgi:hypothetical protein